MPTPLPPSTDFTGASVTEGGFKTAISSLRTFLADLLGTTGSAADARTALSVYSAAQVDSLIGGNFPQKHIAGLTYANNVSDATNDIDIATGEAVDATAAVLMRLSSALTKRLDASWTVGNNQGGLDTGSIGNSDYYIWLIKRSDTGVVDALFSLSSTAPTMPANYDYKRLIGWFKRVGGTIVAFDTYELSGGGLGFLWDAPTLDINLSNTLTTARRTDAVKVPQNFSTESIINVRLNDAGSGTTFIYCPDTSDMAIDGVNAPLSNVINPTGGSQELTLRVRTSATGTVAARASVATIDIYSASTIGFDWPRRN